MRKLARRLCSLVMISITGLLPIAVLAPTGVSAGTNQCSWTGAGVNDNWSNASNWNCSVGTVPTAGYDLIFPFQYMGGSNNPSINDLTATNVYTAMWFTGGGSGCSGGTGYLITGNTIILAGGITSSLTGDCYANNTVATNLTINSATTLGGNNDPYGKLYIGDPFKVITTTLSLGANNTTISDADVYANITGSGSIISTAAVANGNRTFTGTNTFTGSLTVNNGSLYVYPAALGTNAGSTTINNNAGLFVQSPSCSSPIDVTISENFIFNGVGPGYYLNPKFGTFDCGVTYNVSSPVTYIDSVLKGWDVIFSGNLTLNSDLYVRPSADTATLTGAITGNFPISLNPSLYPSIVGRLIINGSTNTTQTPNGTYQNPPRSDTLSDAAPAVNVLISGGHSVAITGSRNIIELRDGGVLKGTGTVGVINSFGGVIAPGMSPGVLNTGNIVYDSATTHQEELGGTGAGQFDQLNVTGTVNLASAALATSLYGGFVPNLNDTFTIINNDGSDAITGTFSGLAQNAEFTLAGGYKFKISYTGGTGNDVVLTSTYVPGPPGTGFGFMTNSSLLPAIAIVSGAGALLIGLKRSNRKTSKSRR